MAESIKNRYNRTVSSGKKAIVGTNWGYLNLTHVIEVEVILVIKTKIIIGIKTLLDIISITL